MAMKGDARFDEIELFYHLYIRNKELSPSKSMKTLNGSENVENLQHNKKKIGGRENFDMALFRLFMGQIDDHWRTALLSTGAINNEGHYPSRELKSEKDILKEY